MMIALLSLALLCGALFLHPYVTYPLSLRLMREVPVRPDPDAPRPSASLLFCAHNEARALPAKLANLRDIKAAYPGIAIYAYDDMSSDATREILRGAGDLLTLVPAEARTGKATGMARMVAMANSDICIFTDANVILPPDSIAPLLDAFRDPAVGGVSGKLRYINDDAGVTAQVGGLYWRLEEAIKARESRCGSMMGADGSIFATRRALYPQVPPHLLDDMTVSTSVMFHGLRLISGEGVIAYEKSTTSSTDEFARKRRIACRAFNTHRHLWPMIRTHFPLVDRYKYISHKVLRWFGAPVLVVGLTSCGVAMIASGAPVLAGALWGAVAFSFWLGQAARVPVLSQLSEIALALAATFLGIIDSLGGKTYQTWAPAKSRD